MLRFVLLFLVVIHFQYSFSRKCGVNEYQEGTWTLSPQVTEKPFICCGYDEQDFKRVELYCGTTPQHHGADSTSNHIFNGVAKSRYNVKLYRHVSDHACKCDRQNLTAISRREKYIWSPSKCDLTPWDAKELCEYLGNRTLMLIGDSTLMQMCTTLINMLTRDDRQNCAEQVFCARTNMLFAHDLMADKRNFTYFFEKFVPDVILFSTGAHYGNRVHLFNQTINAVAAIIMDIKSKANKTSTSPIFYWVGITVGHIGCQFIYEPLLNISNSTWNDGDDIYSWRFLPMFDQMAKKLFERINVSYMDISPLRYRADSHPCEIY